MAQKNESNLRRINRIPLPQLHFLPDFLLNDKKQFDLTENVDQAIKYIIVILICGFSLILFGFNVITL